MDVRWLQDFLTVAETGNFTRAAAIRNASQAAFSRRIQSLEAWLGVALIDRGVFPTQLTAEGQQFRQVASQILTQMLDARAELAAKPAEPVERVRLALPNALATGRLPAWWSDWTASRRLSASVVLGNIHDLVTALVSGNADVLICFHTSQQPIELDEARFVSLPVEAQTLRPYASRALIESRRFVWPGRKDRPVPLLMYSPGVYFGRLVDLIVDGAPQPLVGQRVVDSDMSDVLRDMAIAGHGVAWLIESTVVAGGEHDLEPVGDEAWSLPLSIRAFRARDNDRPAVLRLWSTLAARAATTKARTRRAPVSLPHPSLPRGD